MFKFVCRKEITASNLCILCLWYSDDLDWDALLCSAEAVLSFIIPGGHSDWSVESVRVGAFDIVV